ncbi:hypothetical protein PoB_004130800 [Plakobranchus ocellatus]|uniref:Uncharacterized protein n=1 Tax=Plakobranchus ocellatus TaxID=259542 RepID=A0AAV4B7L7_9GAST|nr:hypothetical protein PoB_004130800 [Plakobranchus ocellatus]
MAERGPEILDTVWTTESVNSSVVWTTVPRLNSHAKCWFDVATSLGAEGIDVQAGKQIAHAQHCALAVKTVQMEAN